MGERFIKAGRSLKSTSKLHVFNRKTFEFSLFKHFVEFIEFDNFISDVGGIK